MPTPSELRLFAKVARLYYEKGLTQPEIAAQMNLSQATISRLIKRAQQENIVRIRVTPAPGSYPELEDRLQVQYDLKDVIVADCASADETEQLHAAGAAAAFYLEKTIGDGEIVGISSWSETLLAMVDTMQPLERARQTQVVQILGGVGNPAAEVHAAHLTRRLAERLRGAAVFLPAPGVTATATAKALFQQDTFVQQAVGLFERVTLALVGIGTVEPSNMLARSGNIFSPEETEVLRSQGAVGDVCLRFFDTAGQPVDTSLNERVIGMELAHLRACKRSVGVAGGSRKVTAIRGALRGGWVNVLITDRFTAEALSD